MHHWQHHTHQPCSTFSTPMVAWRCPLHFAISTLTSLQRAAAHPLMIWSGWTPVQDETGRRTIRAFADTASQVRTSLLDTALGLDYIWPGASHHLQTHPQANCCMVPHLQLRLIRPWTSFLIAHKHWSQEYMQTVWSAKGSYCGSQRWCSLLCPAM